MSKVLSILVEYIPDVKREYFAPFHSKGKTKVGEEILKKVYFLFSFVFLRTGFENEHKHSNWKRVRIRDS